MKIAFINDTHFGVRNDSPFFLNHILNFLENEFIPYLIENKIDTIIHLGDFFDRRKYVNFNTLSSVRKRFIEPLIAHNVDMYVTLGNHDTYYRNTNEINSVQELLSRYSNFTIVDHPIQIEFDHLCIDVIPWITNENLDSTLEFIERSDSLMLCGHLEIAGFQVMSGVKHTHGLTPKQFDKFEMVLSGHFHIKQSEGNIFYLGSQYQMNFGDVNSKKGFHVLDTETRELKFIENQNDIFHVFNYDDSSTDSVKAIASFVSKKDLKGAFVRIFVRNKTKQTIFDKFLDALYEKGVQDVSIVDDTMCSIQTNGIELSEGEDTISIINREVDAIERDIDKLKIKNIIKDLYMESINL